MRHLSDIIAISIGGSFELIPHNPLIPAKAGTQSCPGIASWKTWIPAFAGTSGGGGGSNEQPIARVKTIILTPSAARDIDALPRDARAQVAAGLHRYAMTGQGDVKALRGRGGYRLRIGAYRVIFDEDATTILAIYIGRRATTTYRS